MLPLVTDYYRGFFNQEGIDNITTWIGDARPLNRSFTTEEIETAAKRLNNNRATGPDGIAGEMLKYGGPHLHAEIANSLNKVFERHEKIKSTQEGYLAPQNKPSKPKKAEHTRPLIFLNMIRKVLSTCILYRLKEKIKKYLSLSQHAYTENRSTTEMVWAAQWIKATTDKYMERVYVMGIDLSKAFDCVNRSMLVTIFREEGIANEDELRLLHYVLSETELKVKIGQEKGESFFTTIGTPQGDALSPILFLVYLEKIMREFRNNFQYKDMEMEITYADDVNFILQDDNIDECKKEALDQECECSKCRLKIIEATLPNILATRNMQMNNGKTKYNLLAKEEGKTTDLQILGNFIQRDAELSNRKKRAQTAFNSMIKVWLRGNKISLETKVKLYNSIVLPHLLYNSAAATYTSVQLEKMNSMHRRHLRRLIGIFYPEHISNKDTYDRTNTRPISIEITKMRWKMLGHILRQDEKTPANRSMKEFFETRRRGSTTGLRKTNRGGDNNYKPTKNYQ